MASVALPNISEPKLHVCMRADRPVIVTMVYIWASLRENLSLEVCDQQRRRPACTAAQSDQRLCYLLFGKYHI